MSPRLRVKWKLSDVDRYGLEFHQAYIEAALLAVTITLHHLKRREYSDLAAWFNALQEDRRQVRAELDRRQV